MRKAKRRTFFPRPRKKKKGAVSTAPSGPIRRFSPVDQVPVNGEFQILGGGADRHELVGLAEPMEMLLVHGFTREIEDAFKTYRGRVEDFWRDKPEMIDKAHKLDEVLANIAERN